MAIFDQETGDQITEIFSNLKEDVRIEVYDESEDTAMVEFITELCSLSDNLTCVYYEPGCERALDLEIERVPCLNLTRADEEDLGIRFSGIPAGHEINSLISAILELGGAGAVLPPELEERAANIKGPLDIKIFVTIACPHCPGAVLKSHKLAVLNPNIKAEMVDAQAFGQFAALYDVSAVPKIVLSNGEELIGDQPFEAILEAAEIEAAV